VNKLYVLFIVDQVVKLATMRECDISVTVFEVWGWGVGKEYPRGEGSGRRQCPSPENFLIFWD